MLYNSILLFFVLLAQGKQSLYKNYTSSTYDSKKIIMWEFDFKNPSTFTLIKKEMLNSVHTSQGPKTVSVYLGRYKANNDTLNILSYVTTIKGEAKLSNQNINFLIKKDSLIQLPQKNYTVLPLYFVASKTEMK
jgi:hypothetical protein